MQLLSGHDHMRGGELSSCDKYNECDVHIVESFETSFILSNF